MLVLDLFHPSKISHLFANDTGTCGYQGYDHTSGCRATCAEDLRRRLGGTSVNFSVRGSYGPLRLPVLAVTVKNDVGGAASGSPGSPPYDPDHLPDTPCSSSRWTRTARFGRFLPCPARPFSLFGRGGIHDFIFEVCSSFRRVTPCHVADRPETALTRGFNPTDCP